MADSRYLKRNQIPLENHTITTNHRTCFEAKDHSNPAPISQSTEQRYAGLHTDTHIYAQTHEGEGGE